jgi:hypothetical protein
MAVIKEKDLFLPKEMKDPYHFSEIFIIERDFAHGEIFVSDDELIE